MRPAHSAQSICYCEPQRFVARPYNIVQRGINRRRGPIDGRPIVRTLVESAYLIFATPPQRQTSMIFILSFLPRVPEDIVIFMRVVRIRIDTVEYGVKELKCDNCNQFVSNLRYVFTYLNSNFHICLITRIYTSGIAYKVALRTK